MTAGAIAANFDTARPTVSRHLQILTECELLQQEQQGREIFYHLNGIKMKEIADFIEPFRQMWDDRFNKLESIMKNYKPKK
jgi:DNA-binding transcriptional ArsR family regulator